jgi:hypothetical protein
MHVAELEACLDRGTKRAQVLFLRAISLGVIF